MSDVVDILTRARERINDPAKWHQGSFRDDDGMHSADDCAVCAVGALNWADHGYPEPAWKDTDGFSAAYMVLRNTLTETIPGWNDAPTRTHAEVLAAFDKAIELAKDES